MVRPCVRIVKFPDSFIDHSRGGEQAEVRHLPHRFGELCLQSGAGGMRQCVHQQVLRRIPRAEVPSFQCCGFCFERQLSFSIDITAEMSSPTRWRTSASPAHWSTTCFLLLSHSHPCPRPPSISTHRHGVSMCSLTPAAPPTSLCTTLCSR